MSETCDYIIDVCLDHSDDAQDEGCPYCLIERLQARVEALEMELAGLYRDEFGDTPDEAMARAKSISATEQEAAAEQGERRYPCEKCGLLRTKAEGGTTFTVCDDCWTAAAEQEGE